MKKNCLIICFLVIATLTFSQVNKINSVSLSKERTVYDSLLRYTINSTIDLSDTTNIQFIEVKIKGVASDSVYFVGTYHIPQTESVYVSGVLRDKLMLFIYVGEFMLAEPIYLVTQIVKTDNSKDSPIITNE